VRRARAAALAGLALALVLAGPAPEALAGDNGWDRATKVLKKTYRAKRQNRFALWAAGFAVKFMQPDGVKGVKIALFRDADVSRDPDGRLLEDAISGKMGSEWSRIVQVASRGGERVHVFARWMKNEEVELVVVAVDKGEATVVRAEIQPARLADFVAQVRSKR
jgi:hypothetical protein